MFQNRARSLMVDELLNFFVQEQKFKVGRFVVLSFAGSLFIALTAQLSIPFIPVPITGQTFGVFLVGLMMGKERGLAAVFLYLAEGAIGLPVFAGGVAGAGVLMGNTGGYLLSFLPAIYFCGYFSEKGFDQSYSKIALVLLGANMIVFSLGVLQLSLFLGIDLALEYGLYPFVLGEAIKILSIILLFPLARKFTSRFTQTKS